MTLDELKSQWPQDISAKSETEIQQMVSRKTSGVFSKTRIKALIETLAFLLLILVFMTGLDPERNRAWVNIFLVLTVGTGIVNNLLLYRNLSINPLADDLAIALRKTRDRLGQQIVISGVFSALFFGSIFLFLTLRVSLTPEKTGWLILFLVGSIGLRTGVEIRRWQQHIRQIDQSLKDLS